MKKIESHTLHLIEEILYLLPLNLLRQYYLLLVDDQTVLHGQIVGQTGNLLYNRFVCLQQQQPQVRETEMKTEEDLKNLFLSETTHEFQNLFQEALLFLLKSKSIPLKKHVSNKNRIEKEKKNTNHQVPKKYCSLRILFLRYLKIWWLRIFTSFVNYKTFKKASFFRVTWIS